jgi:indole-3-glycerol phosphate synthase
MEAAELGMDVLWEVHDLEELERVIPFGPALLGINNRDLRTFEVSIETTRKLLPRVPGGTVVVSESGYFTRKDLVSMAGRSGAFLIGEGHSPGARPGRRPGPTSSAEGCDDMKVKVCGLKSYEDA